MGGCDYCVIDTPTEWSDRDPDVGMEWAFCLGEQKMEVAPEREMIVSGCHEVGESGGIAVRVGGSWMV